MKITATKNGEVQLDIEVACDDPVQIEQIIQLGLQTSKFCDCDHCGVWVSEDTIVEDDDAELYCQSCATAKGIGQSRRITRASMIDGERRREE